jgi:NAD(P)-dependent dehydrogenase (short-subunit alcohol dehydrogenase family)
VAIVTGGSRGIGLRSSAALADGRRDVVVASRKLDVCEAVAAEITRRPAARAEATRIHAGHWDDCDALLATTLERFGRLDVLVNNAGMSPVYERLDTISEDLYDKTMSVNLKGPFRLAVSAGTHMVEHDGGSIVNIGTAGFARRQHPRAALRLCQGRPQRHDRRARRGVRPKVRVNAILPGPFRTYGSAGWAPPEGEDVPFVPLRRMGDPAEIAPLAVHLASDASSFTTGSIIRVDGGVTRKV